MPTLTTITGAVGVLAFAGLMLAAWQNTSRWLRAGLALAAAAALITVLTGQPAALIFFAANIVLVLITWWIAGRAAGSKLWLGWVLVLVGVLVAARLPGVGLISGTGNAPGDAMVSAGLWLGISYLIFRLIHVTVDAHKGRIKGVPLPEFVIYALHPASLVAGPIDRIQNSLKAQHEPLTADDMNQGVWRILLGVVGKVVIANPLYTFIAAHDMAANPDQPTAVAWMWLLAYSFYLWADFAAYTNLAIGFGRLVGLNLPENFNWPYFSPSLTVFWQRWHITLSTWARDYVFFPMARGLRTRLDTKRRDLIQFASHLTTMLVIGLWHGLTPGFAVWGLWHGLGMFGASQLAARRPRTPAGGGSRLRQAFSVAGTFAFVTLGWVFFAADLPTALRIFGRLFGIA